MRNERENLKMNRFDLLVTVLLCSIQSATPVSLHLSTGSDTAGGGNSPLALYQAPPTYKEPGKPRLNSIIIKSKPYLVNDSTLSQTLHQTEDGKTWRREALVSSSPEGNGIPQDKVPGDTTTQVTIQQAQEVVTIIPQYTIDCTGEKQTCSETISVTETTTSAPTFKPYSQEELDKYLFQATMSTIPKSIMKEEEDNTEKPTNKLASIYIEDEAVNILESTPDPTSIINSESQDKSKSWNLINSQVHKHPYDDRNGWVSLEPVPWSSSQIQKWEPNPHTRPQLPSWPEQHPPWSKPSQPSRPSQEYNRPPPWQKPVYDYSHSRPAQENYNKPSSSIWNNYNHPSPSYGSSSGSQWGNPPSDIVTDGRPIVTDGRPGYFPSEKPSWEEQGSASYHRPTQVIYHKPVSNYQTQQQHVHGESDGQWVLLSSTKGYSIPQPPRHRSLQRSLKMEDVANIGTVVRTTKPERKPEPSNYRNDHQIQPSMKSHRTVRLTVLPPLNGTTNTTIAHGGLIEVEETQQTVDEAHREHMAKMMKLWKTEHEENRNYDINNDNNASTTIKAEKRIGNIKVLTGRPLVEKSKASSRNNAVLAAVGAGMIPATMAMLLPMVLGRKRRKRDTTMELFIPSASYIHQSQQPTLLSFYDDDTSNKTKTNRKKPNKKINIRKKTQVVYF